MDVEKIKKLQAQAKANKGGGLRCASEGSDGLCLLAALGGPAVAAVVQQSQHGREHGADHADLVPICNSRLLMLILLCSAARGHFAGAKGFRKPVRATGTSESDDKKLSLALKKLGQCWLLRTGLSMPSGRPTQR